MENNIPVFMAIDDAYAKFAAVTIASIMEHTKSNVDFYILDAGVCEINKKKLNAFIKEYSNARLYFRGVDMSQLEDLNFGWFKNGATYMRYFIPELAPELTKVIYTDVDIIFNYDIKDLFETNLNDKALAAVYDMGMDQTVKEHKQYIGVDKEHLYFNAGLLIIDLEKWRKDKVAKKLFAIARNPENHFKCPSQDPMNVFFSSNKYVLIPQEWNIMPAFDTGLEPKLLHFTVHKPWEIVDCNYGYMFWNYARKTLFYEDILVGFILKQNTKIEMRKKKMSKAKRLKYKLLYKITFGKIKKKYKAKYKAAKGK